MTARHVVTWAVIGALSSAPAPIAAQASTYDSLLARARSHDPTLDFGALRHAYAHSNQYAPYDTRQRDAHRSVYESLDKGDYRRVLALVDSLLLTNFVDLEAHMAGTLAAQALRDSSRATFHRWVAEGLLRSIKESGLGTKSRPFVVISITEEYAFALLTGLRRHGAQGLGDCGGHPCDWVVLQDRRTGSDTTLFFDVSLPAAWYDRQIRR